VVTYGAASSVMAAWQAGALAGAASSAAGQVVGNMAGVVDGFSFKDIALGAVTGAISAGVSSSLTGGKEGLKASTIFAKVGEKGTALTGLGRTVTGLASYAGSVAGNKLLGRSSGFSWAGTASTVVGASLSSALGGRIPFMEGGAASEGFWSDFGGGIINGIATATVDRVFGLGKQNWASIVGSALGTAWGNSINSGPGIGKKTSAPELDRAETFALSDAQRATVAELPQEAMGGVSGAPQKATSVRPPVAEDVDLSGIDTSDILATLPTVHVTGDERRDSLFMNYWMWSQTTGYRAPNATEDLKAYYRKAGAWVANDPRTVKYNAWSSQALAAVYSSNGISFNTSIAPPNPYLARYNAINDGIASIFETAEAPFIALQEISHAARMNARAWVLESDSSLEAQARSSFYAWATFGDGLVQAVAGTGRFIANPPQSAAGICNAVVDPGAVWDALVAMPYEDKLAAGVTALATGGTTLVRWMPLGTRGNITPLTQRTSGWDDFGVPNRIPVSTAINDSVRLTERADLAPWLRNTFADGEYATVITNESVRLYRKFGGTGNQAKVDGGFASTVQGASRSETAVFKQWSTMRFEAQIDVPEGQVL